MLNIDCQLSQILHDHSDRELKCKTDKFRRIYRLFMNSWCIWNINLLVHITWWTCMLF